MANWKGKLPAKYYKASHLRQEITPDSIEEECAVGESQVQVPDSQAVVSETQCSSFVLDDLPGNFGRNRKTKYMEDEEQRALKEEAWLASKIAPRKTTKPVFEVNFLARPKTPDMPVFIPFSEPGFKVAHKSIPTEAAVAPKLSPPTIATDAPQITDAAPANKEFEDRQASNLSVASPDDRHLPVVRDLLVPPEIDANSILDDVSRVVPDEVPNDAEIPDSPAGSHKTNGSEHAKRRTKGKKSKKVRKPKPTRAWSPMTHDVSEQDTSTTGFECGSTQDLGQAESFAGEASELNATTQRTHEDTEAVEEEIKSNDRTNLSHQDVMPVMESIERIEETPDPTPLESRGDFECSKLRQHSHPQDVLPDREDRPAEVENLCPADDAHYDQSSHIASNFQGHTSECVTSVHVACHQEGLQETPPDHSKDSLKKTHPNEAYGHENPQYESQLEIFSHPPEDSQFMPGLMGPDAEDVDSRYHQEFQGYRMAIDDNQFRLQQNDAVLHGRSDLGAPYRVSKSRKRKHCKTSAVEPASRTLNNASAPANSPEHESLLHMMAICLRASDSKARGIVEANGKAHEVAIASFQETIAQQNNFIEHLNSENERLQGRAKKMSESAARLQKYVKGMEGDYARLKGKTEDHHKMCMKLVKDKAQEFEQEKVAMHRDFARTVEALSASQRHMRAAMNDCFGQLKITESKYQTVTRQLQTQCDLYDEEKKRCSEFEQKALPAMKALQTTLSEDHLILDGKLVGIQQSLDNISTDQKRDTRMEECLDALRSLQAIPVLTTKDLRKAENFLRFVHERINMKLGKITQSVEEIEFPTGEIQDHIEDQFGGLRAYLKKYDDAFAENRKVQQSNEQLHQQLEAQRDQCTELEESVHQHQQDKVKAEAKFTILAAEMESWKAKACNHDLNPSRLEDDILNLRQQIKKTSEELREDFTRKGRDQLRMEQLETELTTTKKNLREKEAALQKEINDIKHERSSQDQLLRELQQERDNLVDQISGADSKIRHMVAELKDVHELHKAFAKEQEDARTTHENHDSLSSEVARFKEELTRKAEEAALAVSQASSLSSELAQLKQQLTAEKEAIRTKDDQIDTIKAEYVLIQAEAAESVREQDQLRSQLQEKDSAILNLNEEINSNKEKQEKYTLSLTQIRDREDSLREENELLRLNSTVHRSKLSMLEKELDLQGTLRQNGINALRELQNQVGDLQKDKQELEAKLNRSLDNEVKFSKAQLVHISEDADLQSELEKVRTTLKAKENEMQSAQINAAEALRKHMENHTIECDELKLRIGQVESALKEAERIAEHKSRELEAHKKATSEKFEQFVEEIRRKEGSRATEKLSQQIIPHSPGVQDHYPTHKADSNSQNRQLDVYTVPKKTQLLPLKEPETRKKASRQNTTVLKLSEASCSKLKVTFQQSNLRSSKSDDVEQTLNLGNNHATDELSAREAPEENGPRNIPSAMEDSDDSRDLLSCSADFFEQKMDQMLGSNKASSSSFSDPPPSSGSLMDMAPLDNGTSTGKSVNLNTQSSNDEALHEARSDKTSNIPPRRSLRIALSQSQHSDKSHVYTGSQMFLPPVLSASSGMSRNPPNSAIHRARPGSGCSGTTADSGGEGLSSSNHVYRPESSQNTSEHRSNIPMSVRSSSIKVSNKKRKSPVVSVQKDAPSKRPRNSTQFYLSRPKLSSQNYRIPQPLSQPESWVVPTPSPRQPRFPHTTSGSDAGDSRDTHTPNGAANVRAGMPARTPQSKGRRDAEMDAMFDKAIGSGRRGRHEH